MVDKRNLWKWFTSLNELEQTAIARWLLLKDPALVFAFEESSDTLKDFGRIIRREIGGEQVG